MCDKRYSHQNNRICKPTIQHEKATNHSNQADVQSVVPCR